MCAHAIPWTKAMSYLMRGKFIPADECLRLGVATEVVPHEELLPTAERYAQEILEAAPMAVCAIKEAARRGEDLPIRTGSTCRATWRTASCTRRIRKKESSHSAKRENPNGGVDRP